jgi:hypothetical protein
MADDEGTRYPLRTRVGMSFTEADLADLDYLAGLRHLSRSEWVARQVVKEMERLRLQQADRMRAHILGREWPEDEG